MLPLQSQKATRPYVLPATMGHIIFKLQAQMNSSSLKVIQIMYMNHSYKKGCKSFCSFEGKERSTTAANIRRKGKIRKLSLWPAFIIHAKINYRQDHQMKDYLEDKLFPQTQRATRVLLTVHPDKVHLDLGGI